MSRVDKLTIEEIEKEIIAVAEKMAVIRHQIHDAKALLATTGKFSDPAWFNQAHFNLRTLGAEHQSLQMELGKRKRSEKWELNNAVNAAFVDIAKVMLDREVFESIVKAAKRRVK